MSTPGQKKRPSYAHKSGFDLPKWAKEDKKFAYRWVSGSRLERTDGYDPRGWEKAKVPEGEPNAGEFMRWKGHILCKMTMEMHLERKAELEEMTRAQTEAVMGAQEALHERVTDEFKRMGGKIKLNVNIE